MRSVRSKVDEKKVTCSLEEFKKACLLATIKDDSFACIAFIEQVYKRTKGKTIKEVVVCSLKGTATFVE